MRVALHQGHQGPTLGLAVLSDPGQGSGCSVTLVLHSCGQSTTSAAFGALRATQRCSEWVRPCPHKFTQAVRVQVMVGRCALCRSQPGAGCPAHLRCSAGRPALGRLAEASPRPRHLPALVRLAVGPCTASCFKLRALGCPGLLLLLLLCCQLDADLRRAAGDQTSTAAHRRDSVGQEGSRKLFTGLPRGSSALALPGPSMSAQLKDMRWSGASCMSASAGLYCPWPSGAPPCDVLQAAAPM